MKFTVMAHRLAHGWVLQAVEAPGAISEVERLDQADEHMREAIHIVTGVPEDDIQIELVPVLPPEVREHLVREAKLRAEAENAKALAAGERRAAARALRDTGVSVRDLGRILGVSHQRAHQLVSA